MDLRRSIPFTLLVLLLPGWVAAQAVDLRGRVLDVVTEAGVAGAHIRVKGLDIVAVAGDDGGFHLVLPTPRNLVLLVSHVGHASVERPVTRYEVATGEPLRILLEPQAVTLPMVTIQRPAPEVVYQREDLHVGDYLTNDEGVWVLTYERPKLIHRQNEQGRQVFRDARLHVLDTLFQELTSTRLPTDVCRLRHDANHRTIVEGTRCAWVATLRNGEVVLDEISLSVLHEKVLPWTDSLPGQLLGSNFDATFPAFEHVAFDLPTQRPRSICTVQDDFRMELFRSQYKYMSGHDKVVAMDLALETGIDAEIIAGYMTNFHNDIYFKPPYAPLFVVHDTLCVFDHYKERIRRFLPDGRELESVPISYHRERTWRTRLLQDRQSGEVYAVFARSVRTWVRRVDTSTGKLGPERALDHPFPEEVQVHGDHAYFIYRPFGSLQHRTLYRQRIE